MNDKNQNDKDYVNLDWAVQALRQLPPDRRENALEFIRFLAEREGISTAAHSPDFPLPKDSIGLWVDKLRSERRSERTISMYAYLAERFLEHHPRPTRLDTQGHLAKGLEDGQSPAAVENERKALRSLFRFLHREGLWPEDPTEGLRHIRVPYSERPCPSVEDVRRVLEVGCRCSRDTEKIRAIVVLLATTGLRLTEAASVLKANIDFKAKELSVKGKGNKQRVVPLPQSTADTLAEYIRKRPGDSPFLFPGRTKTGYAEIYNIEKTLKRACLRAGVKPFTPHQLRHLYATEMLKGGAKLEVVGRILGHSSIGITADIYCHVRTKEIHESVQKYAPLNGSGESHQA